jgi:hypothetical protein
MCDVWSKFLSLCSIFVILFGLVLAGAGFAGTDSMAINLFHLFGAPPFMLNALSNTILIAAHLAAVIGSGVTRTYSARN